MVYAAAAADNDDGDDDVSVLVEKCMKCWWMLEGLLEAILWESVFVSPQKHFRSERVKKDMRGAIRIALQALLLAIFLHFFGLPAVKKFFRKEVIAFYQNFFYNFSTR